MRQRVVKRCGVGLLAVVSFLGANGANGQKAKKSAEWKVAGTKSGFVTTADGTMIHYIEAGQPVVPFAAL